MKMTTTAKVIMKEIKSDIMKRAWSIAREEAEREGCKPSECLAYGLHMAWDELKAIATYENYCAKTYSGFIPENHVYAFYAKLFPSCFAKVFADCDSVTGDALFTQPNMSALCKLWTSDSLLFLREQHPDYLFSRGFSVPVLWY